MRSNDLQKGQSVNEKCNELMRVLEKAKQDPLLLDHAQEILKEIIDDKQGDKINYSNGEVSKLGKTFNDKMQEAQTGHKVTIHIEGK